MNSSRSVIVTLEDIEVDPAWILEHSLNYVNDQVVQIDSKLFATIVRAQSDFSLSYCDYLKAVYGRVICKLSRRLYFKYQGE